MKLLQDLLSIKDMVNEDAMTSSKVRMLRTQLEMVNKQMDVKQQSGKKIDEKDPLKVKAAKIQAQINQLNDSCRTSVTESRNHMGETEYSLYSSWKRACKKENSAVWFDGDEDICNAMTGHKPYKSGETLTIGSWDGAVGSLHTYKKKVFEGISAEELKEIAKDPEKAYNYAKKVLKGRFKAGEAAIAKDAWWSVYYANYVLNGKPFKAGEAVIATSSQWSYFYARDIIKGPWPAGEAAMAKSAEYSYNYASEVLKGPFPAGEAAIASNDDFKESYVDFLESISYNSNTLLLHSIQLLLNRGKKIYLDFTEGELDQKGLIKKIDDNIVYVRTDLGVWFVQDDADEHFTLRKIANKLVVQKL